MSRWIERRLASVEMWARIARMALRAVELERAGMAKDDVRAYADRYLLSWFCAERMNRCFKSPEAD